MKKIVLAATAILLTFGAGVSAYAATCGGDVSEMQSQIRQYDSITSRDGRVIHDVRGALESQQRRCSSEAYAWSGHKLEYVCAIVWDKGNWGNTFRCKY